MAKGKQIIATAFFLQEDGTAVSWDSLSYDERLDINKSFIRRLESAMPDVFMKHPDSLEKLPKETQADRKEYLSFFPEKRNDRFSAAANT